jgi:uncharacterized protein YcaQ
MPTKTLIATVETVRRLTVTKQRLAGPLPPNPSKASILSVVRDLAYVQWDPVSIVAPSHLLSLWARLGEFRPSDLEQLLWDERSLFEHWTPAASIVLTEDLPLYASLMRRYPESMTSSWGSQRRQAREFLEKHAGLRKKLLRELGKGPRSTSEFADHLRTKRDDGDWSPRSDVAQLLYHLLMQGEVMVVGHRGNQNLWGLAKAFLRNSARAPPLTETEFEREAAQRAIRALGTASAAEITYYFVRGRYQHLKTTLEELLASSVIRRIQVEEFGARDERYIHELDVPLLERLETEAWGPRVTLLPPFDNLICSPKRTDRIFGFGYVREQFLPKEKRRFGTYVLPILSGDRLVGRIDPRMDRDQGKLIVNAVHAEPGTPRDDELAGKIRDTIARLARFLGADDVAYGTKISPAWRAGFR